MAGSEGNNKPVGRTGARDADDGTFKSSEVVWVTAVCSAAITSRGEAEALGLEGGGDAKGSRMDSCVVFGEASILPCIAGAVTGFGEVEGMGRLAGVV